MKKNTCITFIALFISLNVFASNTKGDVDNFVVRYREALRGKLSVVEYSCLEKSYSLFYDIDQAHKYFMADDIPNALYKSFDSITTAYETSKKSHYKCPFDYVPFINQAHKYMSYYYEYQNIPIPPVKPIEAKLDEKLSARITKYFEIAREKMSSACHTNRCTSNQLHILDLIDSMNHLMKDPNPSLLDLLGVLANIRGYLAITYYPLENQKPWKETYQWIMEKTNDSILIVKSYIFTGEELSIIQKYQLEQINLMLANKDILSFCPFINGQFINALNYRPTDNKYYDLLVMIHVNGQLHYTYYKNRDNICKSKLPMIDSMLLHFQDDLKKTVSKTHF